MKRSSRRKVFLVDDHGVSRIGLKRLIEAQDDLVVCGEAGDPEQALKTMDRAGPDVMLADLGLPGMGGLELLKAVRERMPGLPMLVVSMYEESVYGERAFKAGARGYLMKNESPEKVVDALRQVIDGKRYMSAAMAEKILDRAMDGGRLYKEDSVDGLSDRELEVFRLLGHGLRISEIAGKLCLSVKTIESYREHIKVKLRIPTSAGLARYAIEWSHRLPH
jgi:DNA-binding NarL/FixJ family response regulator